MMLLKTLKDLFILIKWIQTILIELSGPVTPMVECCICNAEVVGSIPAWPTEPSSNG